MAQCEENLASSHLSDNSNTDVDLQIITNRITTDDSEQQVKKSRLCHPIWQYLSWNTDKTHITCNLCQQQYSHKMGISTIKGHYITNHKDEWTIIEQQRTIKPVEKYGKKDIKTILHINSLFFQWIICDQQSFSIVENNDFIAFVATLDPRYKLPSRQTVSTKIQWIYKRQCETLKVYFNNLSSKVALTTDVWTACTNQAYMSITLHWINDEWKMKCILLDLIPLHERHTGVILANTMYDTISLHNYFLIIIAIYYVVVLDVLRIS